MDMPTGVTQAHIDEANRIAEEWKKTLPKEFILGSRTTRNGEPVYPDLHFKASPNLPGLYFAQVDPDYISGRKKEFRKTNGNGSQPASKK